MLETNTMFVTDESGNEKEMEILFTFEDEEKGRKYVVFADPEDEGEAVSYTHLNGLWYCVYYCVLYFHRYGFLETYSKENSTKCNTGCDFLSYAEQYHLSIFGLSLIHIFFMC